MRAEGGAYEAWLGRCVCVCVGVDGGGDVGAPVRLGCPAFPVGHRPHLRHLLQRADANPPHLLRLGLEAPHQFPLPVPRGFDDVQRQATGELFFGGGGRKNHHKNRKGSASAGFTYFKFYILLPAQTWFISKLRFLDSSPNQM